MDLSCVLRQISQYELSGLLLLARDNDGKAALSIGFCRVAARGRIMANRQTNRRILKIFLPEIAPRRVANVKHEHNVFV